ncbi:MAG: hypothetical protein JST89_17825 [Cyanobacteria bacterium SZAS-4]|nr:hypothetical protein [Cyanobacteria bacterium SZAS-4]
MQWSKLKKTIESRFASSIGGKIHLFSTQYGCQCGRAWITYNGEQIANFETLVNLRRIHVHREEIDERGQLVIDEATRVPGELMSRGELNRWDLHKACWDYLNMSVPEALSSENPVIQGLAFLDQRAGKRRIALVDTKDLHPLPKKLLEIRILEDKLERERSFALPSR